MCHSGLDKPAPYLIRGNPVFLVWIPAGENEVAGQSRLSGTAHRLFKIAAFIPAPAYRQAPSRTFGSIFPKP